MSDVLPTGIIEGDWPALVKRAENSLLIGVPMVGSILAIDHIASRGLRWSDIAIFALFYLWTGLGVALGFHRLFSHRSFQSHPVIAALLCAGGTMCFQGSPLRWVLDHRRHHALADRAGDVHSPWILADGTALGPFRGFWHAHVGWMFDRWTSDAAVFGKGLLHDRMIMAFSRTHWLWLVASLGLPWCLGWLAGGSDAAWSAMLIGGCLRTTILHHVVWSVNSFGHRWGRRNHATRDSSRDIGWLALLTFGDGWHNGHHASERSHRHGLMPDQKDPNAVIIRWLERRRLASAVIVSPHQPLQTREQNNG